MFGGIGDDYAKVRVITGLLLWFAGWNLCKPSIGRGNAETHDKRYPKLDNRNQEAHGHLALPPDGNDLQERVDHVPALDDRQDAPAQKSRAPMLFSSWLICFISAADVINSSSAALLKLPASAARMKEVKFSLLIFIKTPRRMVISTFHHKKSVIKIQVGDVNKL